jgi:hypothetical protein
MSTREPDGHSLARATGDSVRRYLVEGAVASTARWYATRSANFVSGLIAVERPWGDRLLQQHSPGIAGRSSRKSCLVYQRPTAGCQQYFPKKNRKLLNRGFRGFASQDPSTSLRGARPEQRTESRFQRLTTRQFNFLGRRPRLRM